MLRRWLRLGRTALVLAAAGVVVAGAVSAPARPRLSACKNLIMGTPASEELDGTSAADRILGLSGDDRLVGGPGNDCLYGGFDNDQLIGGPGDDLLDGGPGDDVLEGDAGADVLNGGEGVDHLYGGPGNDILSGGGSGDFLQGGPGADVLRGQGGNDQISGGPGPDTIDGGPGNDDIREVPGGYTPGESLDWGHNRVNGGPGNDRINVANGRRDVVDCGAGRDVVKADKGDKLKNCEKRIYLISPFPSVSPTQGSRTRSFMVKFRSLETLTKGEFFSVAVKGPPGTACKTLDTTSAGVIYHRDRAVRYLLQPFTGKGKRAHRWCKGRYSGELSFTPSAKSCQDLNPPKQPAGACGDVPIGRFSFRVRG